MSHIPAKDRPFPRRVYQDLHTPAEKAITDAMRAVEDLPPDPRLTEAVALLELARTRVADFVDATAVAP